MNRNEIITEAIEVTAKTAISTIPIGGALITCVWDAVKGQAANKRLDNWKEKVEEKLQLLDYSLEEIGNNEMFASAIMKATDIALKTMEEDKRTYLANAVKNSITISISESVMMIYLDLLDRYTVWHLKILHFFYNPSMFKAVNVSGFMMGSPMEPLLQAYPELSDNKPIINKIVKDLYNDGLMNTKDLNCSMTPSGMIASRTTELGNDFIRFIIND